MPENNEKFRMDSRSRLRLSLRLVKSLILGVVCLFAARSSAAPQASAHAPTTASAQTAAPVQIAPQFRTDDEQSSVQSYHPTRPAFPADLSPPWPLTWTELWWWAGGFDACNAWKQRCDSKIYSLIASAVSPTTIPAKPTLYDEIVVTAVGDVMLGTTFPDASGGDLPPNDGAGLLNEVTPILRRGDVVFGNLEGPMVDGGISAKCRGKAPGHCYAFRVPTRYGVYLKSAGFTVMGLANNHAMDFGSEGRESSRHVLDTQGIAHTGEVGDIAHLTVGGRKVAVIAFATYPGAYNLLDLEDALGAVRQAAKEADMVIVSFHGGAEGSAHQHVAPGDETFLGEDRGDVRRFAHAAVDAGAQLVLGSGPHVVRAMEVYHGKLVAYSLGNFATYGPFNLNAESGLSLVLEAHLLPDGEFLRGQIHPVRQEKPGGPKLDPALSIVPIVRSLSKADFPETGVVIGPRGELWLPGTRIPECSNAPDALEQPAGARPCGMFP